MTIWHRLGTAPWRFLCSRGPWIALGYVLVSALLMPVLFGLLLVTMLLLPLWGALVGVMERRRTRWLGFDPQPSPHAPAAMLPMPQRVVLRLGEVATWREVGAYLADLVLGVIALAMLLMQAVVLGAAGTLAMLAFTRPGGRVTLFERTQVTIAPEIVPACALIVVGTLVLSAYLNAVVAGAQASLLRLLCGPRDAELARAVEQLTSGRAALVRAQEAERKRVERDLHDGVQQDLVALSARLAIVGLEADDLAAAGADTGALRRAVADATTSADHALDALRRTVRGLHPAILTDRGLAAALHELAARAPLTVHVHADIPRLDADVETAAYYLVTEAVSNAAKHSTAQHVTVEAHLHDGALVTMVTDDGRGGVDEAGGTGVRGLRERAATLGGSFAVQSGVDGTILRMRVPLDVTERTEHASADR